MHLLTVSPYRSSHAIFVKDGASGAIVGKNQIPEMLRIRLLSVRAFDANGMMVDAYVVDGYDLEPIIERMLSIDSVDFQNRKVFPMRNVKLVCSGRNDPGSPRKSCDNEKNNSDTGRNSQLNRPKYESC